MFVRVTDTSGNIILIPSEGIHMIIEDKDTGICRIAFNAMNEPYFEIKDTMEEICNQLNWGNK